MRKPVFCLALIGAIVVTSFAHAQRLAVTRSSCPETPTVRETPPSVASADPFGSGPWHVNADRTLWVFNASFPEWRQGLNHKVMWIRPGTDLRVTGKRLDAPSPPLETEITCCYGPGFQVGTVTFPAAGCWNVTAIAGAATMEFVTRVWPRP